MNGLTEEYLLSYTAAPLLPRVMQQLAQLYTESADWKTVEQRAVQENIFQKPTVASQKRVYSELLKRFNHLTSEQIKYIATAPMDDVRVIALLGALKAYRLIREFIAEVVYEKFYLFDYIIQNSDYVSFISSKEAHSSKLATISESTHKKLRQVMFNMLHEGGLLHDTKSLMIQKPLLSDQVIQLIVADDPRLLGLFLMSKDEINHYIGNRE
ncbi:MAG TPA: DUF1819 family protein [Sulfuricurvum sp.]|nr:DUF1819 family protein [Sulfuricurvum sp.]HQT35829.1 DUF1819 family protein [Sulfuricurvum sp.]